MTDELLPPGKDGLPREVGKPIPQPDASLRPVESKKGRPRTNPDTLVPANQPIIPNSRASFEGRELPVQASNVEYAQAPRLSARFWKSLGLEIRRPPIRSTARSRWRECPRKFMFSERLGLQPRVYEKALDTGIHFHEIMAQMWRGVRPENLGTLVADMVRTVYQRIEQTADETGLLPDGRELGATMKEVEGDAKMALALATVVSRRYPPERLQERYEVVSVEQDYAIRVPRITCPLVCKPDVLLRSKHSGLYWIFDYKTCSISTAQRAAVCEFEFQPRLYGWIVERWLQLHPLTSTSRIGGWMHCLVRKPTIRQRLKETYEEYVNRVVEWYDEQEQVDPPILLSTVIRENGSPLLTEELLLQIHQIGRACASQLDLARFHKNETACFGKFGNRPCPYMGLCQAEKNPESWPSLIQTKFFQDFRQFEAEVRE